MKTRREFVTAAIPLVAAGANCAAEPPKQATKDNGLDSVETKAAIKERLSFAHLWKEVSFMKRQFLFALVILPTSGESYIDLHGWIYNKFFKEWRRICLIKTRDLGNAELSIDEKRGVVSIRGAANNEFDKQDVFRFDLRATNDDAGF